MSLPASIQEIVTLIGHARAMALVREFGGQELRIPRTPESDTWAALAEVIGEAATGELCRGLAGVETRYIAKCERALKADRNRKIIARYEKLLRSGHSSRGAVSVLVQEFRLCNRQIEAIANSPTPEASSVAMQVELF